MGAEHFEQTGSDSQLSTARETETETETGRDGGVRGGLCNHVISVPYEAVGLIGYTVAFIGSFSISAGLAAYI